MMRITGGGPLRHPAFWVVAVNAVALIVFLNGPMAEEYPLAAVGILAVSFVQIALPACRIEARSQSRLVQYQGCHILWNPIFVRMLRKCFIFRACISTEGGRSTPRHTGPGTPLLTGLRLVGSSR